MSKNTTKPETNRNRSSNFASKFKVYWVIKQIRSIFGSESLNHCFNEDELQHELKHATGIPLRKEKD